MDNMTLGQRIRDNPEILCNNCERSVVWPASIEGPEEIVCKRRMYPDNERCLRHDVYMTIFEEEPA